MKHALFDSDTLSVGEFKTCRAGKKKLIVYHLDDGYYATQQTCTHLLMPLSRGSIVDGSLIQCPFHRAQYDIRTGAVAKWAHFPPGIQVLNGVRKEKGLETYPVTVEDGKVVVDVP